MNTAIATRPRSRRLVNRPWDHTFAADVSGAGSIAEAVTRAEMGWGVEKQRLHLPDGTPVNSWATVRTDTKAVLGTVGAGYRVLQNADAFNFFQPFVDAKVAKLELAGQLKDGSRVWIMAKLNRKDSVIVPKADDRVEKHLLLAHGHDGWLSLRVSLTPIRTACHNALQMAFRRGHTLKIRHTSGMAEALAAAQEAIEQADRDFEKTAEIFRALAGRRVTAAQVRAYLEAVFPARGKAPGAVDGKAELASLLARPVTLTPVSDIEAAQRATEREVARKGTVDKVLEILERGGRGLDLPGVKGTAWAAYNAATEYANWERGNSAENRMHAVWLGDSTTSRMLPAAVDAFLKS